MKYTKHKANFIFLGHNDIVRILIDNGADVNVTNRKSETALLWAAMTGKI